MSEETPNTRSCKLQRAAADPVAQRVDGLFETWPGNVSFIAPLTFEPKTLAEIANAIIQAESAGHHVRACGSRWSFSDAISATTGNPPRPGAMILTEQLKKTLQTDLGSIVTAGVDTSFLCYVEAGIKAADLLLLLDRQGQTLKSGGGSGQSIAGMMSTSTHSGDSLVPPFVDYIRAIHLVGAGGIEHWIEPAAGITDPGKLQSVYPCLAGDNIHYDTELFNAVLVSAGSMGVIYSVILETVPQFGLHQHRVATTWQNLVAASPDLRSVLDGSYMSTFAGNPNNSVLYPPVPMTAPFSPNAFSQIVINPYPYQPNDRTLSPFERAHIGQHLCFVTNRVAIPVPPPQPSPPPGPDVTTMGKKLGETALAALGWDASGYKDPLVLADANRFNNFSNSVAHEDTNTQAAKLLAFLGQNYSQGTICAMINYVLKLIMPTGDRSDSSLNMSEVAGVWGGTAIRSLCVEAAFNVADALAFVPQVLALVAQYAAKRPQVYIAGYLSLRFVGKRTAATLGMQRWTPTCCVEYAMLAGVQASMDPVDMAYAAAVNAFVTDLERLALATRGIHHFGMRNELTTAADLRDTFGADKLDAFRRARGTLSRNGTLVTFDNTFTDRLGLSALARPTTDISYLLPLLLSPKPTTDISYLVPLLLSPGG